MRLLPCFLAGMAFYRFRDAIPWHPAYAILSLLALSISFLIPNGVSFASPTAGAYLLFSLAFFPWFKIPIASRYGDFSYGMYAYAFPIQQSLVAWLGTAIHPWFLFCMSFVATLGVAVLSWHLIEKPALKLKGKVQLTRPMLAKE
jgi:peptidoglycan/LPS O-acetylase OafA/YrhL